MADGERSTDSNGKSKGMDVKLLGSITIGFVIGAVVAGTPDLEHVGRLVLGVFEPRRAVFAAGAVFGFAIGIALGWPLGGIKLALLLSVSGVLTAYIASFLNKYPALIASLLGGMVGMVFAVLFYFLADRAWDWFLALTGIQL